MANFSTGDRLRKPKGDRLFFFCVSVFDTCDHLNAMNDCS